jgi:hypothetical protein
MGNPSAKDAIVAMGMVVAPMARERRTQVRQTMLRYDAVQSGRLIFRFVLGKELPTLAVAPAKKLLRELHDEKMRHTDLVMLDAVDGPKLEPACSCGEKTVAWIQFALAKWPRLRFIGKTEDDTCIGRATETPH